MKKIKEFAVLCGTSSKTLRFYDKIGLLEAEYTDPENGYRYYSDGQKNQYEVISMFKEIGFTLDEIKNEILGADEAHILEILRKKAAELDIARALCLQEIERHEENLRRQEASGIREVTVQRFDEEGKIVVSDGVITRVFVCPAEAMDTCAEIMHDMFCVTSFINFPIDDIQPTDADRMVLAQVLEGTKEEVLSADWPALFGESDHLDDIKTVLMMMKFSAEVNLEDVNVIAERIIPLFPKNCRILWGAALDETRRDTAKVCIVGVY